ncbi:28715_t:CDS:2, partial [Dentiscutata erythropus]
MSQTYSHRLTKYVHVQDKLGPNQTAKRAICKACESHEHIFEKGKNESLELWEYWIDEDQELMMYEHHDESMACTAVRSLRQAREQNNTAMSIISSDSRVSNNNTRMSEASSISSRASEITYSKKKKINYSLDAYVTRPLSTSQKYEFNRCLLRLVVQMGSHFDLLNLEKAKVSILSESQEPVTIMFDGWKNVHCQEILGAIILSASNQLYIWGAEDISNLAMVTDSASAYASARQAMKNAIGITSYFTDKRHSKAISLLRDEHILNYFQHDAANLFDVAYAFGYVAQQYENNVNGFGYKMQQKLEKRWAEWEQPLLLLAIIFHPQYCIQAFTERFENTIETISAENKNMAMNNVIG